MRILKALHGWLGVIVLPWVLIIGLTGLYLNHEGLVEDILAGDGYDEAAFDRWPTPHPMTPDAAQVFANGLFPGQDLTPQSDKTYHGRDVARFEQGSTEVIVALTTGHSWIKTDLQRVTYAPDGSVLDTRIFWGTVFKRLHVRGWLSRSFGTWFSDITAAAMVLFGLTGIVLFLMPRLRRSRNRRKRKALEA